MTVDVAQLMVRVNADTSMAQQGLLGLSGLLGSGGVLSLGIVGVTAGVAGIGLASTKMAGDFQSSLTQIVTGAGESQSNLKLISDGILKLAGDTGTSTKQLTDGLYMIESAGYHGKDGLDVLKAAAEGAKVGNADLGTVSDATTTILKDFGDTGLNANQAVNILISTVANGKTHMSDLAGAMSQILPTAKATGVGLKDAMGAMATMTGEGVDAANAATYLRQMMLALSAPSSTAKSALQSVGLSAEDVNASMKKGLPETVKMITEAVGKKFPEGSVGYVNALKEISGGSRQMQGMLDLSGSHLKDFQTNVQTVGGSLDKGKDKITGWNLVQQDFNQKMSEAKEKAETMMIQLGQKLLPTATKFADWLTKDGLPAVQQLAGHLKDAADRVGDFVNFLQTHQTAMDAFKAILIAVGVVILASVVPAFIGWAIAAGAAAIGTIAATLPVLAIIAAIALLAFGIIELVRHWGDITSALGKFKDGVGKDVGDAFSGLGTIVHNVWDGIQQAIKNGINTVIGHVNDFISFMDGIQIHIPSVGVGPIHTPAFDWGGLHIPKIPALATGGVVSSGGLALVGEKGPEIVTLPPAAQVIPTPQTSALLGSGASGVSMQPIQIIVKLDGRKVAQSTVQHMPTVLRNATGQRGM